jgi:drug/metabolite transporter (DMT)-like permease
MEIQKTRYSADVWVALGLVYLIWGSTYLAIRFAIQTIPPFFMAGTRFLSSGLLLYGFLRFQGVPKPSADHWRSAAIIGFFLLVVGNGGVCWAEQKVPSGMTALLVGTVPLWMVLLEWAWKKGKKPGFKVWAGMVLGFSGIAVLVLLKPGEGQLRVDPLWALLLVGTSLAWSWGSL